MKGIPKALKAVLLTALFLIGVLIICLILKYLTRPRTTVFDPSYSITNLPDIRERSGNVFRINVNNVYYVSYCSAKPLFMNGDNEWFTGKIVGYNDYQEPLLYTYMYYTPINGLPADEWLFCFIEDGTGLPSAENVVSVYKSEDVTDIPPWLEEIHEAENTG